MDLETIMEINTMEIGCRIEVGKSSWLNSNLSPSALPSSGAPSDDDPHLSNNQTRFDSLCKYLTLTFYSSKFPLLMHALFWFIEIINIYIIGVLMI